MTKLKNLKFILTVFILVIMSYFVSFRSHADPSSEAALYACADGDEGDICSYVNSSGQTINGSCQFTSPSNSKLICVKISQ